MKTARQQLAVLERFVAKAPRGSGIYRLFNVTEKRCYIGQASNLRGRLNQHLANLRLGRHGQLKLHVAFSSHGPEHWEFSILEQIELTELAELTAREAYWIGLFDALAVGYNRAPPQAGMTGIEAWRDVARKAATEIQAVRSPAERSAIAQRAAQTRKTRLAALRASEAAKKAWGVRKSKLATSAS